ncbi:hypothetical protein BC829DRAFT_419750 [Chytridium lagenaria]|nr:hypothetical protein BC829DRAFT_419750 [Chytridium lagenaria]
MPLRTVSRSQYLASDAFLRTRDNPVVSDLLPSPDLNLVAASLDNVLSSQECNQVVDLNNASSFIAMKGRYEESKRRGSRLLAIDEKLSSLVWNRIQECINTTVDKEGISTTPLGFGVSTGSWSLDGTNAALRINRFTQKDGLFAPHVDAQYCPHADRRSLLSVVVYLTDDFDGGETKFYFPKHPTTLESASNLKGLTVDEEIKHRGGLQDGYDCIVVKPRRGSAVVFSQNLLHEGTPLRPQVGNDNVKLLRAILRMDVMVRRDKEWKGFAISEAETEDYQACLTYFREAQSQELEGNVAKAGELYERSLSIRYSYPNVLGLYKTARRLPCRLNRLFLKEVDIQKMVLAFPSLFWLLETHQLSRKLLRRSEESKELSSIQWLELPSSAQSCGPATMLRFPSNIFKRNIDGCCRVAAVIAFFRLGHKADSNVYTVSYNPVTQEALAVEIEDVLLSAFYGTPCYGAIFKVKQQNSAKTSTPVLIETYMTYRFGSQFVGDDYFDNFYNRVKCHIFESDWASDDEETNTDSDSDNSGDGLHQDRLGYEDTLLDVDPKNPGEEKGGRDYSDAYRMPSQSPPPEIREYFPGYTVYDHKLARRNGRSHHYAMQDYDTGSFTFKTLEPNESIDDELTFFWVNPNSLSRNVNDMVFDFSRYQLAVTEEESFEVSSLYPVEHAMWTTKTNF